MRSARVFIHPRCFSGPAHGALIANLDSSGLDTANMAVGPDDGHGRRELVRMLGDTCDGLMLERMDGTRFVHKQTAPEVA